MSHIKFKLDPRLDLVLERTIDIAPALVWKAWTTPEHLKHWFCPRPWSISECEIDLRPGGIFRTVMRSPEGQAVPNLGCYLEVVPEERLVWTDALVPGFRPAQTPESGAGLLLTAALLLEPHGKGTKYTAIAMHAAESDRKKHEEMGFHEGWSIVVDQLVEYMKKQR